MSYCTKASLRVEENCTLIAVYGEEEVVPVGTAIIKSKEYDPSTQKAKFNAYLTVPDGATVVKAGLVASSTVSDGLSADNAQFVKSLAAAEGKCAPVSYTWTKTKVESGQTWYVKAYLVYTYKGTTYTVYGDLETLTAP